jgi:hypothetical protein
MSPSGRDPRIPGRHTRLVSSTGTRSIPARTVCERDPEPRGDLFKDLPAYKKYHPQ